MPKYSASTFRTKRSFLSPLAKWQEMKNGKECICLAFQSSKPTNHWNTVCTLCCGTSGNLSIWLNYLEAFSAILGCLCSCIGCQQSCTILYLVSLCVFFSFDSIIVETLCSQCVYIDHLWIWLGTTCAVAPTWLNFIVQGKEMLDTILEELAGRGLASKTFENMPRVAVRWLGRLLPDNNWVCFSVDSWKRS